MIVFTHELLRDVWREMEPLFSLHFRETGERERAIDMDWPTYFALEAMGMVHALIARCDGRLVGYFIGFIRPNLHNRQLLMAVSDMYFLHPAHRGHAGVQMFREVEAHWRARGVQTGAITCKVNRRYDRLFERLGWSLDEQVFLKDLG